MEAQKQQSDTILGNKAKAMFGNLRCFRSTVTPFVATNSIEQRLYLGRKGDVEATP
jgi:hypothetical protein